MSTIVQQHKSDDALIPILNDIHNTITENHSKSNSSIDESFQKLEPKMFELNKFVNYKLTLSNKKKDQQYPTKQKIYLEESYISSKEKPLYER